MSVFFHSLLMKHSVAELATRISRALLSSDSSHTRAARKWSPSLEQTLHRLRCRHSLTPTLVAQVIDPFLLTHHSLALGFFNWSSQQPGFSHTSLTYESILKSLLLSRQFSPIESLLRQVKAHNIDLDASVYRSVIDSLIIGKKPMHAFLVFSEVTSMSQELGPETCNSLLAALASDGHFEHAQKLFDEMTLSDIPLNTLGFGVFIWRFCRTGNADIGNILSMIDEIRTGNSMINGSIIAILIIHGLCQASRLSEACCILEELRNRECKPDFMAYSIIAKAFQSTGSIADRENILKRKRKLSVAPRKNDYKEFIFALISAKRIYEAKELGEVIVRGNFPIEDEVLNVLIGSVAVLDPNCAIYFLNFMVGNGRFPTLTTLKNLGRNLLKQEKIDDMLEVFQVLDKHGYFKDMESYNLKLSFLCNGGKVKEAYEILQEMKKKGLNPDVSSYNSVMEACCKDDLLRPAKRLWDEMFTSGCSGNLKTYNILIGKFSKVGQVEEAQRLFNQMIGKRIKPDISIYISLLDGFCQQSKLESALEMFDNSVKQDVVLGTCLLSPFLLILCKRGLFVAACELLRGLDEGVVWGEAHVTVLKGLADAGEVGLATQHIEWVRQTSPLELHFISTELLALLSSSLNPHPILHILRTINPHRVFNI